MNVNFQQLLVALVMLVPGFIATNIQRAFISRRYATDLEWVVKSLLIAIVLNGLVMAGYLLPHRALLTLKLSQLLADYQSLEVSTLIQYILVLYAVAFSYGMLLGIFPVLQLRALLNRLRIVRVGSDQSVWNRLFKKQRPKERPITWMRVRYGDRVIVGHLVHASEHVDKDKAFEVYLKEFFEEKEGTYQRGDADGLYLRLNPLTETEMIFERRGWEPGMARSNQSNHQTPRKDSEPDFLTPKWFFRLLFPTPKKKP